MNIAQRKTQNNNKQNVYTNCYDIYFFYLFTF